MKPERLYTVGRSAARRAGRPVIIVPKPEPPTVVVAPAPMAHPPVNSAVARNVWSRLGSVARVVGSIIAVAALVISLLTYEDQHRVDEAATIAGQRHQAALVSFILQQGNGPSNETALIDNSSDDPVNDVQLASDVAFDNGHSYSLDLDLGAIPACSVGRITSSMIADYLRAAMFPYTQNESIQFEDISGNYQFNVASMHFIDSNGIAWKYLEGGPVENTTSYASSPWGGPGSASSPAVWAGSASSPVVWAGSASSPVVWAGSASSPVAFSYFASSSGAFYAQISPSNLTQNSSWTNSSDYSLTLESMPAPSFPLLSYEQAGGCS
jgi:hypothetical protein